jgi:hypothetical protein
MRAAGAEALTPLKSANEHLPISVPNTFPFLVASSVKFGGINSHDDLGFTIIFDGRSLCDSSRSASAQYMSASFRYRRLSRSDFVTIVRRAYSFALAR